MMQALYILFGLSILSTGAMNSMETKKHRLSRHIKSDLLLAIHTDNAIALKKLLDNGVNPNTKILDFSLLFTATLKNFINVAKFLIEETDVDVNEEPDNPLYFAIRDGYIEIVQSLLNHKQIDTTISCGDFSLCHVASKNGNSAIVKMLLDHDSTLLNKPGKHGCTPLYIAAQEGRTEVIELLLTFPNIEIHSRLKKGYTPLYIAALNGHAEAVKLFLGHPDILINATDDDGSTALFIAAQNGHDNVVALLLADPRISADASFLDGYSPLYIASQNGHTSIVKALLDHKKNVFINKTASNGPTPLYIAAQQGHTEIVELLLGQTGINVNKKFNSYSPFYIAVANGHTTIVNTFMAYDELLVNPKRKAGHMPLHIACKNGHFDTVKALITSKHININALTDLDYSPLDIVIEIEDDAIINLLLQHGGRTKKQLIR